MKINASDITEGMFIPGIDAYVAEVETGNGYLSYPSTAGGYSVAMPDDTVVITFHDSLGNENYLLVEPTLEIEVSE